MPEVLSEQRLEINRAETDTGTKKKEQKRIKIILIVRTDNIRRANPAFIITTQAIKTFIRMDTVSKTYISESFLSRPPQIISWGIIFTRIST